jgi:hypothetical protein
VSLPALRWPAPDPLVEAGDDSPFRRAQRGARAAREIAADFRRLEGETTAQLLARLQRLRRELQARLAQQLTDPQAPSLDGLIRQVDSLIADATVELVRAAERPMRDAAILGMRAADQPMRALQVRVTPALPGTDAALIAAADDNVVDLLTPPMRQFATDIKTSLRRVAVAGEGRMGEIQRLQAVIAGQGFDNAQFRAERIVRTEMGRVFGEATYARMIELAKTFPFLRKAWVATRDRRTRLGHVEAAQTYARGQGILIADRFTVPVYQEGAKGTKRLGDAQLRFPVDPLATPAGKLAASATIMCRCHAVIDVHPAQFADFARVQVAMALGGPVPPGLPPAPASPPPAAPPPRPPRSPRAAARPRIQKRWPAAQSVAQKLRIPADAHWDVARSAMNAVEAVHGDGPLPRLPLVATGRTDLYGFVRTLPGYGTIDMGLSGLGFQSHPRMTLWHETGHWLDFMAVAKGGKVHPGWSRGLPRRAPAAAPGATGISYSSAADRSNRLLDEWRTAVDGSAAVRTMQQWVRTPSTRPPGASAYFIQHELLTYEELFARSYAQWIALRSQHADGLRDLQTLLDRAKTDPAAPYLRQWDAVDFTPIAAAFDRLFGLLGWLTPATVTP